MITLERSGYKSTNSFKNLEIKHFEYWDAWQIKILTILLNPPLKDVIPMK
jgi:hypothetical protein